jgi:hypothetical protein
MIFQSGKDYLLAVLQPTEAADVFKDLAGNKLLVHITFDVEAIKRVPFLGTG